MNKLDRDALTLALEQARAESPERARQIDSKLEDEPWEDVAEFAAFSAQATSLALQPWESPPCIADGYHGNPDAVKLLAQMLAAGVSKWHPSPLEAIEQAKQKGAA